MAAITSTAEVTEMTSDQRFGPREEPRTVPDSSNGSGEDHGYHGNQQQRPTRGFVGDATTTIAVVTVDSKDAAGLKEAHVAVVLTDVKVVTTVAAVVSIVHLRTLIARWNLNL